MPIYEYRCEGCGKVSSFLVRSVEAHKTPSCPKCGTAGMSRVFSLFATSPKSGGSSRGGSTSGDDLGRDAGGMGGGPGGDDMPDLSALEGIDENDPRSLGRAMRKMAEQTGEKMDPQMDEACRRLESGEDPEAIEEAMGDALGGEGEGGGGGGGGGDDDTLYDA
jgi:putative FmdB family regulatory protein